MPNEKLVKLYTTLTTPSEALGGKAFYSPEALGGSADAFAEKLKDRAKLEKLFTTLTSPSDALGGKAFYSSEALGGNANVFAEKIGFGAEKKNLIGSESTSGSEPFQDKMLGGGVKINPFQPVSAKPIESTKFDPSVIRNIAARGDKKLSSEAAIKTMTSNIAATPRYVYDWTKLAVEKAASLASPTGETGMVLPTFDQVREMTRSSEPNALNSLDYLDKLSKTAAADAEALSQKISTNKLSYIDLFKEGKFGTFIDKTANDLILSAPSMALMTVSPAAAATAFGAGRNLELTDNDTLPADLRLTNSFFTGLSEVFLEGKIGGTALLKNITMQAFKEGGEKAAKEVVNKATRDIMAKYAKKMYGASKDIFLSGVEEATTDFIQQVTDYYTGLSDKIDLTRTMEAAAGGLAAGTGIKALGETVIKPTGKAYKKIKNLNTKASAISQDLDNPNIPNETKSVLQDELIKTNEEAADVAEAQNNTITNLTPTQQKSLDAIAVDMGNMEALLEDPNLSPETKATFQTKLDELQAKADAITSKGESVEYVSEGDNFFKILLDGTKEPITEAEFDQAVSTPKPINEKNGDMVTVNFGGKAITGTVEVDEGGKASIYSGGVVYELPNDTEYVDYASPVRISDTDGSIEFDGVSYPEVRIESMNGTETAVLIDENGKPKTVKDPKIVEEFKYQITLANLAEITEEEAITLLSEYEQDSKTKVDDATEGGVNQADEQKRSEEDIKLQEAIDEIDLIELIALEELDNADANAKLVEYKPTNSKDTKVYLVKKNADGTVSATLDGKKVRRGAVLTSLSEAYDLQSKEGSKKLATKLQEQVNALKADVEAKLFGKAAVAETPVVEQPKVEESIVEEEQIIKQEDAIKESSQQITQGGEQGSSVQRQRADEGQQKAGERKGNERKAEKPKADRGDSIKQSREEQEVVFGTAFDQQEATAEETVGKNKDKWGNAQVWRERIENAGDILRELSSRGDRPDAGYLLEKVNKLKQWVVGNKKNPPDDIPLGIDTIEEFNKSYLRYSNIVDGYNYLTKFHSDVLNKIKSEYEAISTYTKEQELALNLVLDLLNNNIGGLENKLNQIEEIANSIRENKNLPIVKNITTPSNRKLEEPVKEKVTPKKDDSKPTGLSPLETKFKETPEALSKDELKEVLDTKRERYKKAMATIEKGDLEGDALKAKQKAVESLENTIEDLVKRIDSKVSAIESTEAQLKAKKDFIKKYKDDLFDGSLGIAKTPEQMVQAMREDIKFFNAIIDLAYLSIKLRGLKTIEAFKAELEKQLGVKFDKMPQELKDAWNEAKKRVVDEKKQAPTVKQTIKEATEQKTSPEKVATFAEYMAAKYKGMAEGEKIGQKNRFEIIKEAARYVKQAVASDVSRAKINSLINKAISIQNFDSVKSFAKYVDKLIENQEYYAKVAELEGLAAKLGSKVKADKFGSIAPQIRRMLSINPEHLTEEGIDKYIALAKDLLSGKVADVTNLESTLAQLIAEERQTIEAKLTSDLMDDKELVSLIDTMYKLLGEDPTKTISEGIAKAIPVDVKIEIDKAFDKANAKKSEIMEYVSGNKIIKSAKDYVSLIAAIKQYNKALSQLLAAAVISPTQKLTLSINPQGENLNLLEEALKEKLDDFRKSLADQIGVMIASISNQYATGGIRAKLFSNLTDFEKKAYNNTISEILTFPQEVLPDLDINELNDLFKAVEQLSNGYISPKLLESLEIIEAKGYQNSIRENVDSLAKEQAESDNKVNDFRKSFIKSVGDFKGAVALTNYLKTFDYKDISSYFYDAYTKVYAEYIYKPLDRAITKYKDILEEVTVKVISVDDLLDENLGRFIKGKPDADVVRNVVGIFLIQADHLRNPEYNEWSDDKKNLVQYILTQEKKKKIEIDEEDLEFLKEAYSLIEGDISTPEGLQKAKDNFFQKEPLAKKLFEAIRNAIDNDIAPMTKISIEREGGYLEVVGDYFPIQKRGKNFKEVENPFEDMTEKRHSADFKRRDNATYRRTGDPFVMRDFNASRAFNNLAEAASRNYALKPVVTPFYRAVSELANEYEFNGKQDISIFLNAVNDVVFDSMKMQFQREKSTQYKKAIQRSMSFQRALLLTQVIRLGADLGGNMIKAASSMNPIEFSKYVLKSQSKIKKNEFVQLARLVNSPIIFKTSRAKIENVYSSKRVKEKKADALAGWADVISASITWKALIMKNFKEITGKDLDVDALKENPTRYYLENKTALLKAAYETDLFIDKKFVPQSEIGRAQLKRVIPFDSLLGLKIKPVSRTSISYSLLNQMSSYLANDAAVLWAATKRLTSKGDVNGFIADVFPILLSQAAYTSLLSFSSAVASIAGYSIAQVLSGDDDDEPILEYAKEEMDNFLSMYTDPKEFATSYLISVLLTSMGKYAAVSRVAFSIGIGALAGLDINRQPDKRSKKEVTKQWNENYKVIQEKFYFKPYTIGQRGNRAIEPTAADAFSAMPILGFYSKLAESTFGAPEGDQPFRANIMTTIREVGKEDPDKAAAMMGVVNFMTLTAIGFGSTIAPTINKIDAEMSKVEARKYWEEKKKKGGKSNQTKNPFGSSGFGSGGLKGGL